jgi:hypothetical protein
MVSTRTITRKNSIPCLKIFSVRVVRVWESRHEASVTINGASSAGLARYLAAVLEVERVDRQLDSIRSAQAVNAQRLAVIEAGYKFERGSTVEMIGLWQEAEAEKARIGEVEVDREQSLKKLAGLTGYTDKMLGFIP